MTKYIAVIAVVFCFAFAKANPTTAVSKVSSTFFQKFISHQVKGGETVKDIAKKYGISEKEITKLNPDAKKEIYDGLVLILPDSSQGSAQVVEQDNLKFKTHKVKRKETLYSLSKRYGVPQDVIKRYNKRLYSETLRKGDKLRIPTNYKPEIVTESVVTLPEPQTTLEQTTHKVIAKETKYGIARKYGITIAELEQANPQVKGGLKIGDVINVPKANFAESTIINNDKYAFYEVKKGNTMYSLLRSLNLEADELLTLNPALDEGLKEGMILKVPKGSPGSDNPTPAYGETSTQTEVIIAQGKKGSLATSLTDFSTKRVAVMLPFGVNRVSSDNVETNEDLLKNDRILRLSLDLYSGILMAAEDAKKLGISVQLDTYDTAYNRKDGKAVNARKVETVIQSNDFNGVNAVIGPLLGSNIDRASSLLASQNVPVISPMSNKVNGRSNIFVSRPADGLLRDKMLSYLKLNGQGKNVVIIADAKNGTTKSKIKALFPSAKTVTPRSGDNGYYLYPDDIPNQLSDELENWVFIESNDVPLISNVTTNLNAQVGARKVVLFTTNRGSAYDSDEIQHEHLKNLSFHFPSVEKEYKYKDVKAFVDSYESRYNVSPSEYAIRGYDLMYDTLLRLAYAQDLYSAASSGVETDYIENKFKYDRRGAGGFSNQAVYLLKYTDGLQLEEVLFTEVED
ncbi:LysM peptidoglycan-binding domain-containing protein [uncultured Dokdonia sp.]|uniref:LysM peptidoglycan-binding domain-containing protein n=1 Tax=uncultured Dokdonia sp. TaxID=575653 RepID=UPI002601E96B|nr:LysM peptidoglycan-binding domain-containing protein [uncultured Dokdonia sp.]